MDTYRPRVEGISINQFYDERAKETKTEDCVLPSLRYQYDGNGNRIKKAVAHGET